MCEKETLDFNSWFDSYMRECIEDPGKLPIMPNPIFRQKIIDWLRENSLDPENILIEDE